MKKKLLNLMLILASGTAIAQNVQDQKVTFQYIQLPTTPLSGTISNYNVVMNTEQNEKNNQDSLDVYNSKLMLWQANFDTWLEAKRNIDKAYLLELAKHEKAVNAGNAAAQLPVKPAYPEQPIKEEIPMPILTQNVEATTVESAVKLAGFSKGAGGAEITVSLLGFQNATITEKKSGEGAAINYVYTSKAKYPVQVSIKTSSGAVLNQIVGDALVSEAFKTKYSSKYDFEYWAIDNLENYWIERQKQILTQNLTAVNTLINDQCGFPKKTRSTEIYTVKKHKGHNYNDLVNAYTKVNSGYNLIVKDRNHASAKSKIMAGIDIWEKALEESNPGDNKSRINKKITALLYVNLAEAYMWIDDFDTAENYRLKAEQAGVLKYKTASKRLEKLMITAKNRYEAN